MGWIRDAINKAISWLVDTVLRPIVDWVTDAIQWLIAEVRYWKHKFFEMLAEWLENDWFFLGAIAATIVLAVTWPKIITWLGQLSVVVTMKALWEQLKKKLVSIIDLQKIIQLDTINTMLKVIWPEWRAMMSQLSDVVSALAEELGQGTGYIHAYFSVIHGTALTINAFTGADPELGELAAFEHTNTLLTDINKNFRKYAHDPGSIVTDIIDYMIDHQGGELRDAQTATIDAIRDNYNRVKAVNDALHDFQGRIEHFISIQPEEMQKIVSERLQPIVDTLSDALYVMDTQIMPKIDSIIDALELQSERQERINENILSRLDDPYGLLAQAELFGEDDRRALQDYIAELNKRSLAEETAESGPLASQFVHGVLEGLKRSVPPGEPPILSFEPPRIPLLPGEPSARQKDWFVGEF